MKKAFSLLEIIFAIVVIVIISSYAINKYVDSIEKANYVKIKAEVALINNAINQLYSNQTLLGNSDFKLERLDDAQTDSSGQNLFNGYDQYILLDEVILSTSENEKKLGYWIKISNKEYKVYFRKDLSLNFYLDNENNLFSCDKDNSLCKELEL